MKRLAVALRIPLIVVLLVLAYFVWDGLVPRTLKIEIDGRAQVVGLGGVDFRLFGLPSLKPNRKYIAVQVNNPTDYIIRGVAVAAYIKIKPDITIDIPSTPCLAHEFRVLAQTTTDRQTCLVALSVENSKLIPEVDFLGGPTKTVDQKALDWSWTFTHVEGHAQPIKIRCVHNSE